jgi:hypothetical protein
MSVESHTLMDGKVHVYRRENSRFWQCAVYLGGRNHRQSTKHDNLALAFEYARDWYLDRYADERLRKRGIALPVAAAPAETPPLAALAAAAAAMPRPPTSGEKTFREAAKMFVAEFEIITQGERSEEYVASRASCWIATCSHSSVASISRR